MALDVKHAFVSAKADGGDATLVQPSKWNASHAITLATQRVVGRNTGGAGAAEEVTASQILSWVSSTNGVLLTRIAGAWAAAPNVAIDSDGDLLLSEEPAPTTPGAAGTVKVYAAKVARTMLAWKTTSGVLNPVQPLLGAKSIALWSPLANGNTMQTQGINATPNGTATPRVPATTNLFTSAKRIGYVSGAGAGNGTSLRFITPYLWRGNAPGFGGFHVTLRWGWSDATFVATGRGWAGLWSGSGGIPADVDPSTLTNILAVGNNNGDANMQLYAAGAVAQARFDLGANFPANTVSTDLYELHLYCAPGASSVEYKLIRLSTGHVAEGSISVTANLPSDTAFLGPVIHRSNGGTAASVAVDVAGYYSETDN